MADVDAAALPFTSAVVGRFDIGAGLLGLDDDYIRLTFPIASGAPAEHPFSAALDAIVGITHDARSLSIVLREGPTLSIAMLAPGEAAEAIRIACRALPELTRNWRAAGLRRQQGGDRAPAIAEEQAYFTPLLAACRTATMAHSPPELIAAFDVERLGGAFEATLEAFARARAGTQPARRRAMEAELAELTDPLRTAMTALAIAAAAALTNVDDLEPWRAWTARLCDLFEIADRIWTPLATALASVPPTSPETSR